MDIEWSGPMQTPFANLLSVNIQTLALEQLWFWIAPLFSLQIKPVLSIISSVGVPFWVQFSVATLSHKCLTLETATSTNTCQNAVLYNPEMNGIFVNCSRMAEIFNGLFPVHKIWVFCFQKWPPPGTGHPGWQGPLNTGRFSYAFY